MNIDLEAPILTLRPGQLLVLDDAEGTRIYACRGTVWVTEEGDLDDHIVSTGESFIVSHEGRTLVQAMQHARISLQ